MSASEATGTFEGKSPFDLTNHAALVTGSTQGIGRALAHALHQAGARVVFHGLQRDGELSPCLAGDLAQPDGPRALMDEAFRLEGELSILVCNAGGFFDAPFLDMTFEAWEKTFALNVRAAYFLVQAFAHRLVAQKRGGSVIVVSSTNALQAEPDSTAYDASKGALLSLTRSLALSLAPHGIRVNCLAPGLIRTPLTQTWLDARPDLRAHYEKNIPLGRVGVAPDLAGAGVFLASEASAYMTGQVVVVDGGLTASQIGPL